MIEKSIRDDRESNRKAILHIEVPGMPFAFSDPMVMVVSPVKLALDGKLKCQSWWMNIAHS
ncbi:hypothetical protein DsansV1_C02g0019661 [Dioscorea sansibarensis]